MQPGAVQLAGTYGSKIVNGNKHHVRCRCLRPRKGMTASNVVIPWHVSNDEHVRALLGNAAESNTDPVTQVPAVGTQLWSRACTNDNDVVLGVVSHTKATRNTTHQCRVFAGRVRPATYRWRRGCCAPGLSASSRHLLQQTS